MKLVLINVNNNNNNNNEIKMKNSQGVNNNDNNNHNSKGLLKGVEDLEVGGRVETIQTTALLRTVRILRRVLEI